MGWYLEKGKFILSMNPEFKERFACARRSFNPGGFRYHGGIQPLVLMHFSDVHGDGESVSRIVGIKEALGDQVTDVICTGDMVSGRFSAGMDFWDNVIDSESILLAVGNHDVLAAEKGYDWSCRVTQEEQYQQYFAKYIDHWNVDAPAGKTYYKKIYENNGMMMLVLNVMLEGKDHEEQLVWFKEGLKEAAEKGLTVVAISHTQPHIFKPIPCYFHSPDAMLSAEYYLKDEYLCAVDDFMDNGGQFSCWLAGHMHHDMVGTDIDHPKQLFLVVDSENPSESDYGGDTPRVFSGRTHDAINMVCIDTTGKVIKLLRIGANINRYMMPKNGMTIRYDTHEILWQG